eukprot:Lithocolla_globosa_v1_NODE_10525_length_590_cov_8.342056.p2 type:complete len:105 gc:universal NODE_10525_length_590_cov_8.342056:157-471(+)
MGDQKTRTCLPKNGVLWFSSQHASQKLALQSRQNLTTLFCSQLSQRGMAALILACSIFSNKSIKAKALLIPPTPFSSHSEFFRQVGHLITLLSFEEPHAWDRQW